MREKLQQMNPYQFENYVVDIFYKDGYRITKTPKSGDFGVDFIARKDNRKIAVQVKRYKTGNKVGVQDLNQVIGGRNYYNCDTAMMVTTSSMTYSAWELANNTDRVWVWEWEDLKEKIDPPSPEMKALKMIWNVIAFIIAIATTKH